MTWKPTPEEEARRRREWRFGAAFAMVWMVPGGLLSLVLDSGIPLLISTVGSMVHFGIVARRRARARRAHRIAFWSGEADEPEAPLRDDVKRSFKLR